LRLSISKIFERFYRVDRPVRAPGGAEGWGWQLSGLQSNATAGASNWKAPRQGSTFRVLLLMPRDAASLRHLNKSSVTAASHRRRTIFSR
jgi:hypothetical protein